MLFSLYLQKYSKKLLKIQEIEYKRNTNYKYLIVFIRKSDMNYLLKLGINTSVTSMSLVFSIN